MVKINKKSEKNLVVLVKVRLKSKRRKEPYLFIIYYFTRGILMTLRVHKIIVSQINWEYDIIHYFIVSLFLLEKGSVNIFLEDYSKVNNEQKAFFFFLMLGNDLKLLRIYMLLLSLKDIPWSWTKVPAKQFTEK